MQERSEAERRAIWPCLNVATCRSDRAIQQMNSGRFGKRRFGKNMAADVSAKNMPKRLRLKKFAETSRMI